MRPLAILLVLTGLVAGCGVDGAPSPPPPRDTAPAVEPEPPITVGVTGSAEIGVVGGG